MFERLGDLLGSDYQNNYLQKIYLAQKLQTEVQKIVPGDCAVVIKGQIVVIQANSSAYLQALKIHQRKIYAQIKRITPELYSKENLKLKFQLKRTNFSF
jgi:hypothetical protein